MNLKRYSMLPLVLMALPAMSLTLERGNFKIVTPVGSPAPLKLAANSFQAVAARCDMMLKSILLSLLSVCAFQTAQSQIVTVAPLDSKATVTALDFYAPERGILDSITLFIPKSWGIDCLSDVTVNVIGRGSNSPHSHSDAKVRSLLAPKWAKERLMQLSRMVTTG